jgi:hypothetical protein
MVNLVAPPDEAVRGVLWQSRGPWLRLKEATGFKAGQPPEHIDGEVLIERSNVAFIQVLP